MSNRPSKMALSLLASAPLFLLACGGSMKANASAKAGNEGAEGDVNFDVEDSAWDTTDDTLGEDETARAARAANTTTQKTPLLGARHDLLLSEGVGATCKCLAVVLGNPDAPKMVWAGDKPSTNRTTQWVIALGSEGVPCSEDGPGASYMGYEAIGSNVVVHVEAAVEGRPVTHGAIIPRPPSGGKVIVRPSGKIVYGRGPAGEAECTVEPVP